MARTGGGSCAGSTSPSGRGDLLARASELSAADTLLGAIAGTLPRDGGRIALFGRDLDELSRPLARRFAFCRRPDPPDGFRVASCRDGRAPTNALVRRVPRGRAAVERALTDADRWTFETVRRPRLSGGERHRVLWPGASHEPDRCCSRADLPSTSPTRPPAGSVPRSSPPLPAGIALLHDLNLAAAHVPRWRCAGGRIAAEAPGSVLNAASCVSCSAPPWTRPARPMGVASSCRVPQSTLGMNLPYRASVCTGRPPSAQVVLPACTVAVSELASPR